MAAGPCRSTAHTGSAKVGAAALCGHGRPLCAAVGSRNYFRRTAGVYGSRGVEAGSLPRIPANGAERAAPRPGPAPVAAPRTVDRNRSCPQSPSRAAAADPWRTAASLPLSRGGGVGPTYIARGGRTGAVAASTLRRGAMRDSRVGRLCVPPSLPMISQAMREGSKWQKGQH